MERINRLETFLYLVMRDHLPVGTVTRIVRELSLMEGDGIPSTPALASIARDHAATLLRDTARVDEQANAARARGLCGELSPDGTRYCQWEAGHGPNVIPREMCRTSGEPFGRDMTHSWSLAVLLTERPDG
jgi:hypothetical protein